MQPESDFNYLSMSFLRRFAGHFKTITMHKYYVAEGCFRCGLYIQGVLHDLSKFSPREFLVGVRYFDGHRSPNAVERIVNGGLSTAWLHHKGRNRHHFEYWIDFAGRTEPHVYGNRMPLKYVIEMVCDRRAACIVYNKENYTQAAPWEHYIKGREFIIMDPDTRAVLESCLLTMKNEGEDACFRYMRGLLGITGGRDYSAESLGIDKNILAGPTRF